MRLIDADDFIERLHHVPMIQEAIKKAMDCMPTIGRLQEEWIPCSERMPENGHYYLWCSDMGSVQSDYYWNGFEKEQKYGYNIVAWMPLPKPWKGADNETD